ncbi:MAG: hypothetical protein ACK4ND_07710 [Cytophagaceae bacterium]
MKQTILFILSFFVFSFSPLYGNINKDSVITNLDDRDRLIKQYAQAIDQQIIRNEELYKLGRFGEINYILDLRDPAIKKACPPPADFISKSNTQLNSFNESEKELHTTFYVLLTSNIDVSEDELLVTCLEELNKLEKLDGFKPEDVHELLARCRQARFEQSIAINPAGLAKEDRFTLDIISNSKLGDDKHLGALLHYRHYFSTNSLYYHTSVAFDKRISPLTISEIRNEIIDPIRNALKVEGEKGVTCSSLFTIFDKEISNAIQIFKKDFKSDYDLFVREAVELLDKTIVSNDAQNSNEFNPQGKKYVINTGSKTGPIAMVEELDKKLAWHEFNTGQQVYVILSDGINSTEKYFDFAFAVFTESKQLEKSSAVLLTLQYEEGDQLGQKNGLMQVKPGVYSELVIFSEQVTNKTKKALVDYGNFDAWIIDVYKEIPKPLSIYSYFFRIDGIMLYAESHYDEFVGSPEIVVLDFRYDKENVKKCADYLSHARKNLSPDTRKLYEKTTIRAHIQRSYADPKVERQPHNLKEEFIAQYHKRYIDHYLFINYHGYFDKKFPAVWSMPSGALIGEQPDLFLTLIDGASLVLAPFGLDVIPDLMGGVYCTYKGDYIDAGIYYVCASSLFIPGGAAKQFFKGADVAIENGILVVKSSKEIDLFSSALYKKLNELETVMSGGKEKFLVDFGGSDDLIKLFSIQPNLVDGWRVLKESGESGLSNRFKDIQFVDDYLRKNPEKASTVAAEIQTKGWVKWVDEVGKGAGNWIAYIGKNINELAEAPVGYQFYHYNGKKFLRRINSSDLNTPRLTVINGKIIKYDGQTILNLSSNQVNDLAISSTKNSNSSKGIMLGKYDEDLSNVSYNRVAKDEGYIYFEMDNWDEVYKLVNESKDEMWKINEQVIKNQFNLNKPFYFSHNPNDINIVVAGSFYEQEIELLKQLIQQNHGEKAKFIPFNQYWKLEW